MSDYKHIIKLQQYNIDTKKPGNDVLIYQHNINFIDEYTPSFNMDPYRRVWMATKRLQFFNIYDSISEIERKLSGMILITVLGENDKKYLVNINQILSVEELSPVYCRISFLSNMNVIDVNNSLVEIHKQLNKALDKQ